MTTVSGKEVDCCICGAKSNHTRATSTTAFGSPDLDTRPPEMERSTICHWIQRCPSCGYCAPDISECSPDASIIIKLPDYQNIVNNKSIPDVAASFMALSYEKQHMQIFLESAWSAIHAAWICDDENNDVAARECRLVAISMIAKGKAQSQNIEYQPGVLEAITIDLMRRAGMFREAMNLAEETLTKDMEEIITQVVKFEVELINLKDIDTHTISEALSGTGSGHQGQDLH